MGELRTMRPAMLSSAVGLGSVFALLAACGSDAVVNDALTAFDFDQKPLDPLVLPERTGQNP